MDLSNSIEDIKEKAEATLSQIDSLKKLMDLEIPGRFVFSPPSSSRLCVKNLEELHKARAALHKHFGWSDHIANKFFSCGVVIVTYRPENDVKLPLPFELWVEAPPESFPEELLGDCRLEKYDHTEYSIVCPMKSK